VADSLVGVYRWKHSWPMFKHILLCHVVSVKAGWEVSRPACKQCVNSVRSESTLLNRSLLKHSNLEQPDRSK